MNQLNLGFVNKDTKCGFTLNFDGKVIAKIDYTYFGSTSHLKQVRLKLKEFKTKLVSDVSTCVVEWENQEGTLIYVWYGKGEIQIHGQFTQLDEAAIIIPVVNKSVVISDIDNIIKYLKSQTKKPYNLLF